MHSPLLLIQQLALSDVIDNDKTCRTPVEHYRVRIHLDVDYSAVPGLVSPRARNNRFTQSVRTLNQEGWSALVQTDSIYRHRQKLFSRESVSFCSRIVYG